MKLIFYLRFCLKLIWTNFDKEQKHQLTLNLFNKAFKLLLNDLNFVIRWEILSIKIKNISNEGKSLRELTFCWSWWESLAISSWASSSWCEISRCECFRAANSRWTTNVVSSSSARDTWPRTSRAASALDSASSNSIVCLSRRFSERSLCQHHHSLCEYLRQWQIYGEGGGLREL